MKFTSARNEARDFISAQKSNRCLISCEHQTTRKTHDALPLDKLVLINDFYNVGGCEREGFILAAVEVPIGKRTPAGLVYHKA